MLPVWRKKQQEGHPHTARGSLPIFTRSLLYPDIVEKPCSAPLAKHVEQFMKTAMCAPVCQGYGLTETCGSSFIALPEVVRGACSLVQVQCNGLASGLPWDIRHMSMAHCHVSIQSLSSCIRLAHLEPHAARRLW